MMKNVAKLLNELEAIVKAHIGSPKTIETPQFSGETYEPARDYTRLSAQYNRVFDLMSDGAWRTLADISGVTHDPQASVSARLRDMRKQRFGGHSVIREYMGNGLFAYRLEA